MRKISITRIFTGEDQKSYFEDIELPLSQAEIGFLSSQNDVNKLIFGEIDDLIIGWHNPSSPQYVIMIQGDMEIEIGNGEKRVFNPGEIVLAEDITGQGHFTRATSPGLRRYIVITKG